MDLTFVVVAAAADGFENIALKLDIYANLNLFKCHQTHLQSFSLTLSPCVIVLIFLDWFEEDWKECLLVGAGVIVHISI